MAKGAKAVNCVAMDNNWTFGSDDFVVNTAIKLQCCTTETYILQKVGWKSALKIT